MQEIVTKYLVPAGYEFQKIEIDFQRLLEGKELFEEGGLEKLEACKDNNARFEILEQFKEFVLPQYDDVVAAFPGIRQQLVEVVRAGRQTDTAPIETPFGSFDGKTYEQITDAALDILERIRYVDVEDVFSALCEIYLGKKTESEGERILKAVENLAAHNLDVWKQAGPFVQSRICERISDLNSKELEQLLPVSVRALSQVLSTEAESTPSTYSTVTFHRKAIQPSAGLNTLRDSALGILKGMYSPDRPEQERRQILTAMWQATDIPRLGQSSDELDLMTLRDSAKVVAFLTKIVENESHELNQHFEYLAHWLVKRYRPWSEDETNAERGEASKELIDVVLAYRDKLNGDPEFVIYKTLVGFESVFPPEWDEPDFDIRGQDAYRQERIAELLESVEASNADLWLERIVRCAQTESLDAATFPHFGRFLEDLANSKPQILMAWLPDLDERVERFLGSIIIGLEKSADAASARELLNTWIREKKFLHFIARAARYSDDLDIDHLAAISDAARTSGDVRALLDVIATVLQKGTDENSAELKTIALDCIAAYTELNENRWVHDAWIYAKNSVVLGQLNTDEVKVILDNLRPMSRIDYHVEAVLSKLAADHPSAIVEFFGDRIRHDREIESVGDYDAVPFSFHAVDRVLLSHPDKVVDLCRGLFDEDDAMFEFRGGRLIKIVFPEFSDDLEAVLIDQIWDGEDSSIDFVLAVLRTYEGQTILHELVQEVVNVLDENDKRLNLIENILDSTGVVFGEFGMREAYQRKREEVAPWFEDKREKIRLFAERYTRLLDRQIAAEQRRAQEDIEMRKRDYGENDDADGD